MYLMQCRSLLSGVLVRSHVQARMLPMMRMTINTKSSHLTRDTAMHQVSDGQTDSFLVEYASTIRQFETCWEQNRRTY